MAKKTKNTNYVFDPICLYYSSNTTDNIPELHKDIWWGCHTFETLVPPSVYFDEHPEYFSQWWFKRRKEDSQLCLTNPELVDIVANNLIKVIEKNPNFEIYSITQNDNDHYCRCKECRKQARKYGQSGLMINFVNQVARKVKEVYPDKKVGTFAYWYSVDAPKDPAIVPDDNVVIRFISIESCYKHSLDDPKCCRNKRFWKAYKQWMKLTPNIAIWEYGANFFDKLGPFPNFDSLYRNIQVFHENNCKWGFTICGTSVTSELSDLRTYMIMKSMENPYHDLTATLNGFINEFYGEKYSTVVKQYISLLRNDPTPWWRAHFRCFHFPYERVVNKSFLKKAIELLDAELDGTEYANRLEQLFMGVAEVYCWCHPLSKLSRTLYPRVKEYMINHNINWCDDSGKISAEKFFKIMEFFGN